MKFKKVLSWLTAAAFGFCIAYAGVTGMVSGFALENVSLSGIIQFTLLFAAFAAGCFTLRWGGWVLAGSLALAAGFLLRGGEMLDSVEGLLFCISKFYDSAYGCGLIQWSTSSPEGAELTPALCLIAELVSLCVVWTVCRRKNAIFAVVPGILPLAACLVVTDAVPDSGYLILLMTALLLLVLTQRGRRRSMSDGLRQTALLLIPAILSTLLLFWAVPRESYTAKENQLQPFYEWLTALKNKSPGQQPNEEYTPETLELSAVGPKTFKNVEVMEVTAESGGVLYLRGQAYDSYDGLNWDVADLGDVVDNGWPVLAMESKGEVRLKIKAGVGLKFFPYYPDEERWWHDLLEGRLDNPDMLREYTFERGLPTEESYRLSEIGIDVNIRQQCLRLPAETAQRAEVLLKSLELEQMTVSMQAARIGQYVRESAEYSLNTAYIPKGEADFAFWFLEESETGYCVHFATAAAVLLRAAGIPARYVTGYTVTALAGQTRNVLDSHAHAWVEYFVAGEGWKVLDPTPSRQIQLDPLPTVAPVETTQPTQPEQTIAPTAPSQTDSGTEHSSQPGEETGSQGGEKKEAGGNGMALTYFAIVFGIFAGVGLIVGQYWLRRNIRKKKMYRGKPNAQALARWREVCRYGKILKKAPPESLLELAEKARFSQHSLTGEELKEFALYLKAAATELGKKNWAYRLLCRLVFAVE